MNKVYLAHSSDDKNYVDQVADLLGRARVVFDKMVFPPGGDFRTSIRSGLDKSRVLVLFASRKSLDSTWVKFEIDEAEWRLLHGQMGGALTIIISDDVGPADLPKWMQRCLARSIPQARLATYAIRNFLMEVAGADLAPIFVGRELEMAECMPHLIPGLDAEVPRIVVISGLEGTGRKTFAHKLLANALALPESAPQFVVNETDTIENLYVKMLTETSTAATRAQLVEDIAEFRRLTLPERGKEVARLISQINQTGVAPYVVDTGARGAMMDESNWYREEWLSILQGMKSFEGAYLVIIQTRQPSVVKMLEQRGQIPRIAYHRLLPLNDKATELLLRESLRRKHIDATDAQVMELTPFLSGYPPVVALAMALVEGYGVSNLVADKRMLTDFLRGRFEPLLSSFNLPAQEKQILRILAAETQLPLAGFSAILECPPDEVAQVLRHLVDVSLVHTVGDDYTISSPIRVAVSHVYGILGRKEYGEIGARLRKAFWEGDQASLPAFSIIDTTIHSLAYSDLKGLDEFRDMVLPSQLSRVAKQKYNAREWRDAEELATRALSLDPGLKQARVTLFRCLVRQRKWTRAEQVLKEIEQTWALDKYYLRGFLEWKRGDLPRAVSAFYSGWKAGDESVSILRDLAHCLFHLGDVKRAKEVIGAAAKKYERNEYVVDLAAQIAIHIGDEKDTERYLAILQRINEVSYYHRLATLKIREKRWGEALTNAEKACESPNPRFEALAQRASILIETNDSAAEAEIAKLDPQELGRFDVKEGLFCKLYVRRGQWKRAEDCYKRIRRKELPVHVRLHQEVLALKLEDPNLSPRERKQAIAESGGAVQPELPLVFDAEEID